MNAESSQVTQKPVFNVKYLPIVLVTSFLSFGSVSFGQEVVDKPLYTTLTADLQPYNDISRGFKLLRPYGYNEFDGSGGYIKKFSSLTECK